MISGTARDLAHVNLALGTHGLRAQFRATALAQLAELEHAVGQLRQGPIDPEAEVAIAPALHLLKGDAAIVGLMELAAALHAAEGRAAEGAWDALAAALAAISRDLQRAGDDAALAAAAAGAAAAAEGRGPQPPDEPDEIDQLSQRLLELSTAYNRLATGLVRAVHDAPIEAIRDLSAEADAARRQLDEVLGAAWSLRQASIEGLLQRAADHALRLARAEEKPLEVRIDGGRVELKRAMLDALEAPLLQLVRNAVSHGVEAPGTRGGKPPAAVLSLEARLAGGLVEIAVEDDGRGLDPAVVRDAAVARGVLTGDEAAVLSQQAALELLIESGAGRARSDRGLDAVRARIEDLGGAVALLARPGLGTRCVIAVPAALARERAVVVECAGSVLALPARAVRAQLRLGDHARRQIAGRIAIQVGEAWVPLCGLGEALGLGGGDAGADAPALLLEGHGRRRAFAVDRVDGEHELLRQPGGAPDALRELVPASSITADGRTALWPSVPALLGGGRGPAHPGRRRTQPQPAQRARRVLIADDSPLVLEIVKSILRGVQLVPSTAPDGEAAWSALEAELPDLLVTDVEMPRLDGLGLLRRVRARWPGLPVVVLTTRDGEADRRHAMELGASAYLIKAELDESRLVEIVRGLIDVAAA